MFLKWIFLLLPHRTLATVVSKTRLASPSEDDCSWCFRVQNYEEFVSQQIERRELLSENAKKIRKSLVVCENMYNFAAVFQIYVNKEQCCNKEWTYQHCYHSRAKRALEASAMFIRTTRWVLQHVTGIRQISNEHHQIENLTGRHRCSRPSEHRR